MTHEEYLAKMTRVEDLCGIDPEPDSAEGLELCALVEEVCAYELEHYPLRPRPETK